MRDHKSSSPDSSIEMVLQGEKEFASKAHSHVVEALITDLKKIN